MKLWQRPFVCLFALVCVCAVAPAQDAASPYNAVDPLIGTAGGGNTFPGATLPFGMIQWSPDTGPDAWYDYGAKYTQGGMELKVPARISASARARVMELALETFEYAGCEGLARVDFFVDGERVLVNELNTMPGFTPTSVYAKLMEASGIAYPELVDRLCRLAIERHERQAPLSETA